MAWQFSPGVFPLTPHTSVLKQKEGKIDEENNKEGRKVKLKRKRIGFLRFIFFPFLSAGVLWRRSICKDELKDHRVYFFLNLMETHTKKNDPLKLIKFDILKCN